MTVPTDPLARAAEFRRAGYWGDETFPSVIDRWADADPSRPYLADGTHELTYGGVRDRSRALAAGLAARGVRRGDRVAVQLPNWAEFFLVYAACARLGAVTIPLGTIYRAGEIRFTVADSGATVLVTCGVFRGFDHPAMAAAVVAGSDHEVLQVVVRGDPPDGAVVLDDLLVDGPLPEAPSPDDPHLILYSSGTESHPKGCLHTWNTSAFLPKQAIPAMGMTREDVMFMPSPVTHALGLTLGVMAPTLAGASVVLLDVFDPAVALEVITTHRCTGTASPAPFIRMLLDAYDPDRHDPSRLRFWLTAGAPIPAALVEGAARTFSDCRVVSAYGSSEVMMATVARPEDSLETVASTDGGPVPGVELRIVGADGEPVPTGEEGEIRYRGPGRLLGYWGRPDLTAAALDGDGWWGTGDTGRLDGSGYLRVTGRIKDIIIRGGYNVSAREVEEAVAELPGVAGVAVIGVPDERVGERVCAVVEPAAGHEAPTLDEVRAHVTTGRGLASWKAPDLVEVVDEWPTTATGKVQKFRLRERFSR
jgi:acyl-CoA synthetase (AMP-forming)/AMP-acid ligase II